MKRTLSVTRASLAFLILATVPFALAQASTVSTTCAGTAEIPFDFWIGDSHLGAGNYLLDCTISRTLVAFRNIKTNDQEQAFFIPIDEGAPTSDYKLIFVLHDGKHYLQEMWNRDGRAVLTSRFGVAGSAGDTRDEVTVTDRLKESASRAK